MYCFAKTENTICDLGCLFKNFFFYGKTFVAIDNVLNDSTLSSDQLFSIEFSQHFVAT